MKISSSILLSLLLVCAARAQEAATWQLLPEARVDSSGIFLPQLVQLVVPSSASSSASVAAASSAVLPQIRLASAPSPGQTASFSRSQISELVQKNYSGLIVSNWSGATLVRVSRRTRQFSDSDMTELLTATLQRESVRDRGELELHLIKPWAAVPVPDEPLTLKFSDLPASGVSPSFVINCELWTGSERVGAWPLTAQAKVWRDIPLAHSPLVRGQLLKDADITLERRDVLAQRDAWLNYPTSDASLELTENIPEGLPVLNRSVHARPLIHRGRLVDGLYQDGGLIISLKVETLEDGLLGQIVRVRNPKTKHEIYGKVQNEQTVLISL
jgi:flagella basal body P-ring formation protein FlgA